jgi:hypothetical protein
MDKALQRIGQLSNGSDLSFLQKQLERIKSMPGSGQIFKRIASAPDMEQLTDYLAEVRFALIFAGLGFIIEIEPLGNKGPDLRIERDGHQVVVEIMRFRRIFPGPSVLDLSAVDFLLPEYGDPARDTWKAFEKILAKFPQVGTKPSIIAIWNDEEELEDKEVEAAVYNLRKEAALQIRSLPPGLLFILFGSKWIGDKQLYCFPVRQLDPYLITWQQEFAASTVSELVHRALAQSVTAS